MVRLGESQATSTWHCRNRPSPSPLPRSFTLDWVMRLQSQMGRSAVLTELLVQLGEIYKELERGYRGGKWSACL